MIRHQDVPAKTKVQLPPRFLQSADEQRELIPGERGAIFAKIDRDEENPASDEQALHSGHSRSVIRGKLLYNTRPTAPKTCCGYPTKESEVRSQESEVSMNRTENGE